jgi:hypothetical protein
MSNARFPRFTLVSPQEGETWIGRQDIDSKEVIKRESSILFKIHPYPLSPVLPFLCACKGGESRETLRSSHNLIYYYELCVFKIHHGGQVSPAFVRADRLARSMWFVSGLVGLVRPLVCSAAGSSRKSMGPSQVLSEETHRGTLPLHPNLTFFPNSVNPLCSIGFHEFFGTCSAHTCTHPR